MARSRSSTLKFEAALAEKRLSNEKIPVGWTILGAAAVSLVFWAALFLLFAH